VGFRRKSADQVARDSAAGSYQWRPVPENGLGNSEDRLSGVAFKVLHHAREGRGQGVGNLPHISQKDVQIIWHNTMALPQGMEPFSMCHPNSRVLLGQTSGNKKRTLDLSFISWCIWCAEVLQRTFPYFPHITSHLVTNTQQICMLAVKIVI
jgi:hypothetical protein